MIFFFCNPLFIFKVYSPFQVSNLSDSLIFRVIRLHSKQRKFSFIETFQEIFLVLWYKTMQTCSIEFIWEEWVTWLRDSVNTFLNVPFSSLSLDCITWTDVIIQIRISENWEKSLLQNGYIFLWTDISYAFWKHTANFAGFQ